MPTINIPAPVRFGLYAFTAVGTPVVAYLVATGILGDLEQTLWAAEVTVVLALAAAKTPTSEPQRPVESPHDRAV